jgi:hypothetical protein
VDISYKSFLVETRQLTEPFDIFAKLSKQLFLFISENMDFFAGYDRVVVRYDNGQYELTKVLVTIFSALLDNVVRHNAQCRNAAFSPLATVWGKFPSKT